MALNPNKPVAILFGTSQRLKSLSGLQSVNVAGVVIILSGKVKILGAALDANLTMAPHIEALSSSCFYHIRSFRQSRSSMDDSMALSVASALISSRLDQLNSILYGTSLNPSFFCDIGYQWVGGYHHIIITKFWGGYHPPLNFVIRPILCKKN